MPRRFLLFVFRQGCNAYVDYEKDTQVQQAGSFPQNTHAVKREKRNSTVSACLPNRSALSREKRVGRVTAHLDLGCLVLGLQREVRLLEVTPHPVPPEAIALLGHRAAGKFGRSLPELHRGHPCPLLHLHALKYLRHRHPSTRHIEGGVISRRKREEGGNTRKLGRSLPALCAWVKVTWECSFAQNTEHCASLKATPE